MMRDFKTKAEASRHRYGKWAGNENGFTYDPACCAEEVHDVGRGGLFHQCYRPNGHGPWKLYCAQHDPEKVKARREAMNKKQEVRIFKERPKWYAAEMLELLKQSRFSHTVAWQRRRNKLIQEIETP